jgi:predicted TIM-barrel fold metal-dependent hydrolase
VLLQALADRRLPLSIWHTEVPWEEIRNLCQAYPELPVILEGTPLKILYYNRLLYPLLAQCPNLRLEIHNLVNYLGIEDITRRFGARRLVFGSFMPVCDPNAAMMQVTHARIGEEDKVKIARGNLMELLAGVQVP